MYKIDWHGVLLCLMNQSLGGGVLFGGVELNGHYLFHYWMKQKEYFSLRWVWTEVRVSVNEPNEENGFFYEGALAK